MPKATVDEDGDSQPKEDDVRHSAWLLQDGIVDAIPQAHLEELAPKSHLGLGSCLTHLGHTATGFG